MNNNSNNDIERILTLDNNLNKEKNFWLNQLSGEPGKSYFPYDFPANGGTANIIHPSFSFTVPEESSSQLNKIANNSAQNLLIILLALVKILLYKFTGNQDIIIAVPIYKQKVQGNFVNTVLLIRTNLAERTFKEILVSVKKELAEANDNLNYPIEKITYHLSKSNDGEEISLFETALLMENVHEREYLNTIRPNIIFTFKNTGAQIEGVIEYNPGLYKNETIQDVAARLNTLAQHFIHNLDDKIADFDILTGAEREYILHQLHTGDVMPEEKTYIELFEKRAAEYPSNIAIVDGSLQVTYQQLNNEAEQLAVVLSKSGVKPNSIVGIMIEPSYKRMVAVLAVLKAQGAYLPIDAEYPDERITFLLNDSGAAWIITQTNLINKVNFKGTVFDIHNPDIYSLEKAAPPIKAQSFDTVYLIYTSGSTGNPKGVKIKNISLVNYVRWVVKKALLNSADKTALLSSFAFDLGYTAVYSALACGAELHILPKEVYYYPDKLINYFAEWRITYLKMTPSLFNVIIHSYNFREEALKDLRLVILGGEPIRPADLEKYHKCCQHTRIINHYGPTEATIGCIAQYIDFDHFDEYSVTPTIGKPIDNMKAFIMDQDNRLLPCGMMGQLCISGIGLADGYVNNPELSATKFVENPYISGEKLYKTGDLAVLSPNGHIRFIGRNDTQIKIRGYRIEIGEVEAILNKLQFIEKAVVLPLKKDNHEIYLCGFIVLNCDQKDMLTEIHNQMLSMAPEYMVPSKFVFLDQMPLTENKKVDMKALLAFEKKSNAVKESKTVKPRNEIEQKMMEIWSEVLGVDDLQLSDNFFELGGHSISMIQIINRLRNDFSYQILLNDFFQYSTIEELSALLERNLKSDHNLDWKIRKRENKKYYSISPIQYPEWYLQKMNPESTFYNQNYMIEIKGKFNIPAFIESMNILILRHDAFRTAIVEIDGKPYQVLHETIRPVGEEDIIDIRSCKDKEQEIKKVIDIYYDRVFDFSEAPIFRIKLIQVEDERAIFLFSTHHIAWDQLSSFIFFEELSVCYNAISENREVRLAELEINYVDYTEWLNGLISRKLLHNQRQYWLDLFSTIPEPLDFTTDHLRPPIQAFKGMRLFKDLRAETRNSVEDCCKKYNVTKQIFFLTVLNLLIYRYTGQKDFVVGTPIANRDQKELESLIGLFAAALPIRCNIDDEYTFLDLLSHTKAVSVSAYDNHLYPFNLVLEELKTNVDFSRSKIISVFFGVQNDETELYAIQLKDLDTSPYPMEYENYTTAFDFTLQINHSESYIYLSFRYDTEIFTGESGPRFFDKYVFLLEKCLENPELNINRFPLCDALDESIIHGVINQSANFVIPNQGLASVLERACGTYSERTAVVADGVEYSFQTLRERSNQFAHYLLEKGIKKGEKVAVLMPSSFELIVVLLGILKTGAAYIPLHHEYSANRIEEITQSVKCALVVATLGYGPSEIHVHNGSAVLDYEKEMAAIKQQSPEEVGVNVGSDDTAYIIFTSGSTGKPKGIEIFHRGVVNLLWSIQNFYQLGGDDAILFHTPVIFDAAVLDIFLPLFTGSKIIVLEDSKRKNILDVARYIDSYRVTMIQFVPLMLDSIIHLKSENEIYRLDTLKYVIVGAAILNRALRDKFFQHFHCKLLNHYGPTEITVDAAFYDCSQPTDADIIPVGKPIGNTKIYILDSHQNLCPVGAPGELYISSIGISCGYLGLPELTAAKFIKNPFHDGIGDRLFKTGDRAMYTPDGYITVLGRLDNQVKVNGNRVELEEIENQLLSNSNIKNAAVVVYQSSGGYDKLAGFVELEEPVNTIVDNNGAKYRLYTLDQNPALKKEFDLVHHDSWPKYFEGSQTLREYWNRIYQVFPEYQLILVNESGQTAAIGNSIPLYWNGENDSLPKGWDGAIIQGFKDYEDKRHSNTLVMMAAVVHKDFKGTQLSQYLIDSFKAIAKTMACEHLLVILRPIGKTGFQEIKLEEYAVIKDGQGLTIDKWLQLHLDKGGVVLKYETESQEIAGTYAQWQAWEGQPFNSPGTICFKDTLQPVSFDSDTNVGTYYDPGIWLQHSLPEPGRRYASKMHTASLMYFEKVSEDYLRRYLSEFLPYYMVPNQIFILHQIPRLPSGKNDMEELKKIEVSYLTRAMVTPQNQQQAQLFDIFKEILHTDRFGIYDSFFEAGGHSILALLLLAKIEQVFEVKIPVVDLLKNPTIYDLANYLKSYNSIQNNESDIITLSNSGQMEVLCVPSLAAAPVEFVGFANTFTQANTHVLNINLLDQYDPMRLNVAEVIGLYLDSITAKMWTSPLVIIGYSIGAILAFEITKKLEQKGVAVKHLVVIDSKPNTVENPLFSDRIPDHSILKQHPDYQLLERFSDKQKEKLLNRINRYYQLNREIVNCGRINAPISVLSNEIDMPEILMGWNRLSNNETNVYQGKGNHYELINEKFIKKNEAIFRKIIFE